MISGAAGSAVLAVAFYSIAVLAAPTQAPPSGNPTFPLQGPAGPAGAKGDTGLTGPEGPAGPAGTGVTPSLEINVNTDSNTTAWRCATTGSLQAICGDTDGCRVRLMMQHKLAANDEFRVIDEIIGMETPGENAGRTSGIYGWTRDGYSDYSWISGGGSYDVFAPWGWVWMSTHAQTNCGYSGAALSQYNFMLMTYPHIRLRALFYD